MRAIGIISSLDVTHPEAFVEFDAAVPELGEHDVLVKVAAISFNPLDIKMRQRAAVSTRLNDPKILGWDGVGEVTAVGSTADRRWLGQRVMFTGDITRQGSNAEYISVDSRGIATPPVNWSDCDAATLALVGVTSYEAIYDRLELGRAASHARLLIIGGAGGVGSLAIQLAKLLPNCTVIATASRKESKAWCQDLGADYVVDHHVLESEYLELDVGPPTHILNCASTEAYWVAMANLIAPRGRICSVVENYEPVDLKLLMRKSVTFCWEHMNTSQLNQEAPLRSAIALESIAKLAESEKLRPTRTVTLKGFTIDNIKRAHQILEDRRCIGKVVLEF